jgi:hypothetical protein
MALNAIEAAFGGARSARTRSTWFVGGSARSFVERFAVTRPDRWHGKLL